MDIESKISAMLNDPAGMEKIMAMAQSLGLGGNKDEPKKEENVIENAMPAIVNSLTPMGDAGNLMRMVANMDPGILNGMSRILSEYSKPEDHRTRLIHALKPYMHESRHGQMDRAVRMIKLAATAKIAMETFGSGGLLGKLLE
ncbi:MAG: hypothetical protein FWE06_02545 [Oscillospiraceae bacterium]|nr:hypothetical protein [Oscillospiraceae bacterium]